MNCFDLIGWSLVSVEIQIARNTQNHWKHLCFRVCLVVLLRSPRPSISSHAQLFSCRPTNLPHPPSHPSSLVWPGFPHSSLVPGPFPPRPAALRSSRVDPVDDPDDEHGECEHEVERRDGAEHVENEALGDAQLLQPHPASLQRDDGAVRHRGFTQSCSPVVFGAQKPHDNLKNEGFWSFAEQKSRKLVGH